MSEEPDETGKNRDEQGRFIPGVSGHPEGRPADTEEAKIAKKALKITIAEYKEKLAEVLPQLSPVIIALALKGDMSAIKEIHDRIMGKAPQDLNLGQNPELPFLIKIEKIDGKDGKDSKAIPETV